MKRTNYFYITKWRVRLCQSCRAIHNVHSHEVKKFYYARDISERTRTMKSCGDFVNCFTCKDTIVEFGAFVWRPRLLLIQGGAA